MYTFKPTSYLPTCLPAYLPTYLTALNRIHTIHNSKSSNGDFKAQNDRKIEKLNREI